MLRTSFFTTRHIPLNNSLEKLKSVCLCVCTMSSIRLKISHELLHLVVRVMWKYSVILDMHVAS